MFAFATVAKWLEACAASLLQAAVRITSPWKSKIRKQSDGPIGAADPGAARALYDELRVLAADHPAESELRLWQAKAAVNLIHDLGAGEPAAGRALYDELRALAADHPAEPELQEVGALGEAVFPRR